MPDAKEIEEMQKERGLVKSCTELERLFKVDIVQLQQNFVSLESLASKLTKQTTPKDFEIELQLHFVNKERDPQKLPVFKRFRMKADPTAKKFLAQFEGVAKKTS